MKTKTLLYLLFVSLCGTFSCDDDKESDRDKYTRYLTEGGTWTLTSATVDGVESDIYNGLTVTFTSGSYTSTNGGAIWPASGTWSFDEASAQRLIRDDGTVFEITSINEEAVVVDFTWTDVTYSSGRVMSTSGNHTFRFER